MAHRAEVRAVIVHPNPKVDNLVVPLAFHFMQQSTYTVTFPAKELGYEAINSDDDNLIQSEEHFTRHQDHHPSLQLNNTLGR